MFTVAKQFRTLALNLIKCLVSLLYPQVQQISTKALYERLTEALPPILRDARQAEEYAISHLLGTHFLPTVEAVQQSDISPKDTLIVYCSVGYRSAQLAQKLQEAGYLHVINLEGSIFEWYNCGYPVVVEQTEVQQVHPFSPVWKPLLASREDVSRNRLLH